MYHTHCVMCMSRGGPFPSARATPMSIRTRTTRHTSRPVAHGFTPPSCTIPQVVRGTCVCTLHQDATFTVDVTPARSVNSAAACSCCDRVTEETITLWMGDDIHEDDCTCPLCREWLPGDGDEESEASSSQATTDDEGWQPSWWMRWVEEQEQWQQQYDDLLDDDSWQAAVGEEELEEWRDVLVPAPRLLESGGRGPLRPRTNIAEAELEDLFTPQKASHPKLPQLLEGTDLRLAQGDGAKGAESRTDQKPKKRQRSENDSSAPPRKAKPSSRELPERSKELLLQWCHDHIDHPYPSAEEKVDLSEETDLTLTQLRNWFDGWRKARAAAPR